MDKSWINKHRTSPEYLQGLNEFLDFSFAHNLGTDVIACPCSRCAFKKLKSRQEVKDHLLCRSFPIGYTSWYRHGEIVLEDTSPGPSTVQESSMNEEQVQLPDHISQMHNLVHDVFGVFRDGEETSTTNESGLEDDIEVEHLNQAPQVEAKESYELLKDGEQELYDGCTKFSRLSLLKLYNIKLLYKVSDKAFSELITLLHDAFEFAKIPSSGYEAKKIIKTLGLSYTKIDACPKDCMLYWGVDAERQECKECKSPRYKPTKKGGSDEASTSGEKRKKRPAKIFRYFPLIPRLKRLFISPKTAENMIWHSKDTSQDGIMRHPKDSEAWKKFDLKYPSFAADPRNVRLALASDGFNPFGSMSSSHSTWPVILIPYNNPPWLCMKQTNYILSSIIPGKKMPGNDIDIYLQPMISYLKKLWEQGVETYDAAKGEIFMMRAALMWTISDFPGLGNLSGWNTYTGLACPSCNFDAQPLRLDKSKKWCFMGSRRFLPRGHRFRLNKARFDGHFEDRDPPKLLSGSDILEQTEHVKVTFGKREEKASGRKRKRVGRIDDDDGPQYWRKRSIFFKLPYWKFNLLRHNLDVMHIEKNVCDNILFTLLNDKDKRKDHLNARKDLVDLNIKEELWPKADGKTCPSALFTLEKHEIDILLETLKDISVPDGYSGNISACVDLTHRKMSGLKSHDSHVLMHEFLPLAISNIMPKEVASPLIELCSCFKYLCSKVVKISDIDKLQQRIVLALCHLEMYFPPSFFTVMVHLVNHLAEEVRYGGPVKYRWMYPIERFLGKLKSFVGNRAQPEGSSAERWQLEEIVSFSSLYLEDESEKRFNRGRRVDDQPDDSSCVSSSLFPRIGRAVDGGVYDKLTELEKLQAHRHVLVNCNAAQPFIQEFRNLTKRMLRHKTRLSNDIEKEVHRGVVEWFRNRIQTDNLVTHSEDLQALARGPMGKARRFNAYEVNGYRFQTLEHEKYLTTQNSGVFGSFGTKSYASSSDNRPVEGLVPYYGKLIDIVELNYYGAFYVTLFKCKWANTTNPRYIEKDAFGFTLVNFSHLIHTGEREDDEPYIQAAEAQMVYYVEDKVRKGWSIPVHIKPRDLFDMGHIAGDSTYESETVENQNLANDIDTSQVQLSRVREAEF